MGLMIAGSITVVCLISKGLMKGILPVLTGGQDASMVKMAKCLPNACRDYVTKVSFFSQQTVSALGARPRRQGVVSLRKGNRAY
eukprot:4141968-Pyramimonas_sp.AAC.3